VDGLKLEHPLFSCSTILVVDMKLETIIFDIFLILAVPALIFGLTVQKPLGVEFQGQNVLGEMLSRARKTRTAIPVIGVHDSISARIVAQQHQRRHQQQQQQQQQLKRDVALFVSGFGVSASRLGQPDAGILTRTDMEDATRNILASVPRRNIPVIMDGDTGYGGSPNVRQTIRRAAALGVAAISIEDQVFPKRCTYIAGSGINVIDRGEAVKRVKAALAARDEAWEQDGNHILVIARTDCRLGTSFDEALERCLAFQELDADIVYAENLQGIKEYTMLRQEIDKPMMLAQVQTGSNDENLLTIKDVGGLGYELALWGITGLQAAVAALEKSAAELLSDDEVAAVKTDLASLVSVKDLVGMEDLCDFESRHLCT